MQVVVQKCYVWSLFLMDHVRCLVVTGWKRSALTEKNLPGIHAIHPMISMDVGNATTSPLYSSLAEVLHKYAPLFEPKLGCYKGAPVDLHVTENPKFHKARLVPYANQRKVEAALRKMEFCSKCNPAIALHL